MENCLTYRNPDEDSNLPIKRRLYVPLIIDKQKQVDKFKSIIATKRSVELHFHSEDIDCDRYNNGR